MPAQQYCNKGTHEGAQNLIITAERVEDETSEHVGLYRVTDANNVVGHITQEQLDDNWILVEDIQATGKARK